MASLAQRVMVQTARVLRVHRHGGTEVLQIDRDVEIAGPAAGQGAAAVATIDVLASGVNFIDTYHRTGLYKLPLPAALGREGVGIVRCIEGEPSADTGIAVGSRVAFLAQGAHSDTIRVPTASCVAVPDAVGNDTAAAVLLQGLTAHYLATDCHHRKSTFASAAAASEPPTALVHSAAGGTGSILVQMLKIRGYYVIGTVGSESKKGLAEGNGCDAVVVRGDCQAGFDTAVRDLLGGRGVDVVFDGIGRDTFTLSLDSLAPLGTMVTFGNASGAVPPFAPLELAKRGSISIVRPKLDDYIPTEQAFRARASELLGWLADGKVNVKIGGSWPLEKVAEAHAALESGKTTGKLIITHTGSE